MDLVFFFIRFSQLLVLIFLIYPHSSIAQPAAAPSQALFERSVLQEFAETSNFSEGAVGLSDWLHDLAVGPNDTASHCNWTGITCEILPSGSSSSIVVVALDLQSRGLLSPLSTIICSLPYLTRLSLSGNSFHQEFPSQFLTGCGAGLSLLNLSYNHFHGDLPQSGWSNLSSTLTHLDLASNLFSGQFPPAIGNDLPDLEYLNIWDNSFSGYIPPELGNLTRLTNLSIAFNNYVPGSLPEQFRNLSSLTWLYCAACNLVGPLPTWLSDLSNLRYIEFSYNQLSGSLPPEVFSWPHMERIELYFNSFTGIIPPVIGNLSGLLELDLSCNRLEGPIPPELGKLSSLTLLNLWNNSLTGEIPMELANLSSTMEVFQLFQNKLVGTVPQDLGRGGKMLKFDVSTNFLHGPVPPYLCDGGVLIKLIFFSNNISGSIPEAYGNCPSLVRVRLFGNSLTGTVPTGLWSLPSMTILELYDNQLSGTISPDLGGAAQLTKLAISGNAFAGDLPYSVGALSSLEILEAFDNQLSSSIPSTLLDCHNLTSLRLDKNALTGSIPDMFASIPGLTIVNLSYNRLTGPIPPSLGDLGYLQQLDLAHNSLSGSVPVNLSRLKYSLVSFDVSYNRLSGELPFGLGGAFTKEAFEGNEKLCVGGGGCGGGSAMAKWLLVVIVMAASGVLVVGLCCFWKQKSKYERKKREMVAGYNDENEWIFTRFDKLLDVDEAEVRRVVDDEDNIIARGGCGDVYLGRLKSGRDVAIKKIRTHPKSGDGGFQAEVDTLGLVRHTNLVKLLCSCTNNRDTGLLVYEYMPNGSLSHVLHGDRGFTKSKMELDWGKRFQIALGTARGLAYLHHDCVSPIVHRDVKPNNILLDSNYEPHIADFGLAKLLSDSHASFTITGLAGSIGYMAPEMAYARKITNKCDVYSYGVVLMELLTGKKAASGIESGGEDLVKWVTARLQSKEQVTGSLFFYNRTKEGGGMVSSKEEEHEMLVVLKLALRCTAAIPSQRPEMKEVVSVLEDAWRQSSHSYNYGSAHGCSISHSSSSKHLLSSDRWKHPDMELPSPGAVFELDARLSGR